MLSGMREKETLDSATGATVSPFAARADEESSRRNIVYVELSSCLDARNVHSCPTSSRAWTAVEEVFDRHAK